MDKQRYYKLVKLIRNNGKSFRKRHGEWIRVKIYNNTWLVLDTWNSCITVHKGACEDRTSHGYTWGFEDRTDNIGMHFGGFRSHVGLTNHFIAHFYA